MVKKITVIGAGNGGQAIAGHAGLLGYEVWIYDIDRKKISALQGRKRITLIGTETGSTDKIHSTLNLKEAVSGAEMIMVVTAATSHQDVAREIAPFLEDGQIVILHPGYFLGALAFHQTLEEKHCMKRITIADTESLVYSCRSEIPGEVYITGVKKSLLVATFPGKEIDGIIGKIKHLYPQCLPTPNILETTFGNVNFVLHTPIALFNSGSIDSGREFLFYYEGGSPAIMRFEEGLDRERLAVANCFGLNARSIKQLLTDFYGVEGSTLFDIIKKNPAYAPIKAPQTLQTRLITEDVPMGLVPLASAAKKFNVEAPLHRLLVDSACALMETDYWSQGRTIANLGLSEMDRDGILKYLNEG